MAKLDQFRKMAFFVRYRSNGRVKKFLRERKMSKEHFARIIITFINSQEGARDPDRSLGPDPGYAFQGVFDSVRSGVKILFLCTATSLYSFKKYIQ